MLRIETNSGLGRVTLWGQTRRAGATGVGRMRVFGSYALVYCFEGRAYYRDANGLQSPIRAGDLLLVFPELGHSYGPEPGRSWSEFYLVFEGPVFELWRRAGFLDARRPVHHVEPVAYWLKKFQSVLGTERSVGLVPPALEVCRLQQVLAEALAASEAGARSAEDAGWITRACGLLERDLRREQPMPVVAKKLGISYESFRKRFIRLVGVSPARYRARKVIEQACRLMQERDWSNKQIADQLGFSDEFHFSHRFKSILGRSPRRYRKTRPI